MDNLNHSLAGLPLFGLYFAAAIALLALFVAVYIRVTPYRELALIRAGNSAAALSLSGAILGFVLPLASAVAHSVNFADMLVWGVVALVVQVLAYLVARTLMPHLTEDIPADKTAPALLLAALSVATGVLNAACMSY